MRTPHHHFSQGAALLSAMLTVTLVASFAASALWQQWRAIEIESAERTRTQAAWVLLGALDWSRLILREDTRGSSADHLAEPWAVPLQEARLSTFLAAQGNVSSVDDASVDTSQAFLSGQITDMQSRLNLRNLLGDNVQAQRTQRQITRLFERLGLPDQELALLLNGLKDAASAQDPRAALLPSDVEQLTWLGLSPSSVQRLAPHLTMLPIATPVNLNTASADVLWAAIDGLDAASAQRLVQVRQSRYFRVIDDVRQALGQPSQKTGGSNSSTLDSSVVSVSSDFFEVRGQLRLDHITVQERSLVQRRFNQVLVRWRQRSALPAPIPLP